MNRAMWSFGNPTMEIFFGELPTRMLLELWPAWVLTDVIKYSSNPRVECILNCKASEKLYRKL